MRYVLVTGVSTGIGYDITKKLVDLDYHVFGSVRKQGDALRIKKELGNLCTPLIFDVTNLSAIEDSYEIVKTTIGSQPLLGLINNAGIAVSGPILHVTSAELQKQFDVNVNGVLNVTRIFLPLLKGENAGRIINVSSVSGKRVFPFLGAYAASKHALEAISDALRRELMIYGIDVIVIEPGSTKSYIWEKAPQLSKFDHTDYKDPFRKFMGYLTNHLDNIMPVEKVTKVIFKALTTKNPRTRYVVVKNKFTHWWLAKLLPDRKLDKIFAKMMSLKRTS